MSRPCEPGCTCGRHRALRVCIECGQGFKPKWGRAHVYCSRACATTARQTDFEDHFTVGDLDECWLWEGTLFQDGLGYGRWGQRRAHVEAWERANGQKVPDGLQVLHACDKPPCVNPSHLYVGTHADNMRDRKLRQRDARGTAVNTNKLTEEQVYAIRDARDGGEPLGPIADRFGVTPAMVSFIARRKSWAWLPER